MGALDYKTRRHRRTRMAAEMYATWTPRRLFTFGSSVGGAHWFDSPSLYPGGNHLYLYQDSAGASPVTAVGQTIGLSLDRAYGGARGPEMASAGYATPATYDNVTTVVSATAFTQTVGTTLGRTYLNLTTVVGKTYEVSSSITTTDASGILLYARALPAGTGTILATSPSIASGGTARVIFTATTTTSSVLWSTQTVARIVNATGITVREIPGTHLIQATGTARPTLSARVNLLLNSENFSNASWTKRSGGSVSATNSATAPNGTVTADTWLQSGTPGTTSVHSTATVPASANLKHSISVKPISGQWVALAALDTSGTDGFTAWFDLTNGVKGTASTSGSGATLGAWNITPEANGFYRIDVSGIVGTDTSIWSCFLFVVTADGSTTRLADGSCYVWGADLRTADDAAKNIPAYQRVGATAADHDTDGFPHYALFDGTDDSWASAATVDGSATDKFTLVTGVTKNSDAAVAVVVEHGDAVGSFDSLLMAPRSAGNSSVGGDLRVGGLTSTNVITTPSLPAASSGVFSGVCDKSATTIANQLRYFKYGVGALTAGPSGTGPVTGNFFNATMYYGGRGPALGGGLRFNGRLYSLVGRFGAMSDTDRNRLEQWTKNLMRLP